MLSDVFRRCISSDADCRQLLFYENRQAGCDSFLDGYCSHEFVCVTDSGCCLAHIGHFSDLRRAALRVIKNHIVCIDSSWLFQGESVDAVLPDPICDRFVVLVVLNASDDSVSSGCLPNLESVELINLDHLKFERDHSVVGVNFHE